MYAWICGLLLNYLKNNTLPVTEIVSQEGLLKLDQDISVQEVKDRAIGMQFPLYSELKEENLDGEPSKNHIASIAQQAFQLLPENLMDSSQGLAQFIRFQFDNSYTSDSLPAEQCNTEQKCIISFKRAYYGNLGGDINHPNTVGALWSDLRFAQTLIHEYAHYLDLKVYNYLEGQGKGAKIAILDTNSFYSIAYDLNTEIVPPVGWSYYKIKNDSNDSESFFITQYADGWEAADYSGYFSAYEDFAESFSSYIFEGDIFRCKAEKYPILKQKYDWLKQNVFNQTEYAYEPVSECTSFPIVGADFYELNPEFAQFKFEKIKKLISRDQ